MVAHQRPAEVPGWFDLRDPNGVVVENLAPPHRSAKPLRPKSRAAGTLESIVAFAYGRDPLLNEPLHLALDSKQRLIVVDPRIPAVHVLTGEASFRIAGGPNHRLQSPHSVAADADDNIYVGDRKTGLIQVFNSAGAYLRSLGMFRDEPIFQEPTAIALDRENRRLFVLDTPVNELLVLDLEGNIIRRIGGHRHLGGVNFDLPNEIALRGSTIAVLDSLGTRLHIFDREGKLDSAGNVYVSNGEPGIRIYSPAGKLVGRLPNCDRATPGLWIDPSNRMYIADPSIGRVNVFQLSSAAPQDGTAAAADSQ
jgi:sugar lactone lactonase YvrE